MLLYNWTTVDLTDPMEQQGHVSESLDSIVNLNCSEIGIRPLI